jgi:hypothetical protein
LLGVRRQGTHTSKVKRFNDTLNFAVYKVSDTKSKVIAFSISNIGGALGDEGEYRYYTFEQTDAAPLRRRQSSSGIVLEKCTTRVYTS